MGKVIDVVWGLIQLFPVWFVVCGIAVVQCATGCTQVEAQTPADVVEKLQAVCALAPVVDGIPKDVVAACAAIQAVPVDALKDLKVIP